MDAHSAGIHFEQGIRIECYAFRKAKGVIRAKAPGVIRVQYLVCDFASIRAAVQFCMEQVDAVFQPSFLLLGVMTQVVWKVGTEIQQLLMAQFTDPMEQ